MADDDDEEFPPNYLADAQENVQYRTTLYDSAGVFSVSAAEVGREIVYDDSAKEEDQK